ncbi:related to M-phase inducer phosphatase [Sporisorium reilianum SRZ2]|uniref:M-phase inducer phosphatase n=1 Tax=Sporisorium reilianum (strain SRZ2) TaxID=999809 RepID=E6ZK25_SPORE|nr:related to M-phase inducer phosphatase [Sporisorium reilianum SRZ2]
MATLLSSPLAPAPKFDLFQQPSSPKCCANDDLPADFDKSFGSSMSISDSLDGHASQGFTALSLPPQPFLFGAGSLGLAQSLASANKDQLHHQPFLHNVYTEPSKQQQQQHPSFRPSPRPSNTLGAAMGTTLNARSPGLAAKMSSPRDMDISPAPVAPLLSHIRPSPSDALPKLMDNIHVGASSTAASTHDRLHPVLGGSSRARPAATERKSSLQLAHTMSSRLFGAEIALNSQRIFARDRELLSSPDKEPPPKRRPNSLPTRQSEANERISQLSSALMGVASAKPRPALSATFADRDPSFAAAAAASSSSRPSSSLAVRNRLSDSGLMPGARSSKRSSRTASAASFFEDVENELGARQTLSQDRQKPHDDLWQRHSLVSEPGQEDDEDDINPSPSPSMNSISGAMADYFYDPLSPEKLASRLGMASEAPSLLAAMSSTAASPGVSSPPASSPCTRMPPPKRTTSLGTRAFERANTVAVVPRAVSGASSSSGVGALRTSLGKRANPYVKRPSLTNDQPAIKSAYPVLGVSGQTSRVVRPTAPAPRRCFSAFDQSSVLGGAAASAPTSKLGVNSYSSSVDSPVSPDRRRPQLSGHGEVTDANGSPIAPGTRARARPGCLRRGSKDDTSPLAYGTGMKRSGSRGNDTMMDDLALADPAYTNSPASAESLPGFGASEKEGKVLPCFNVKDDGLMRITPHTMTDLLAGKYTNAIMSFQVVDCRFGYEYEGGHIPGAINLSTVDRVVGHFLKPGQGRHANGEPLPLRSQSGKADKFGNRRKHVLVFHCEFSCKRAPTMALALRQADRALAHDYPNCHFPEIYILQGGYCNFFQTYANLCEPQQYVCMDDPRFLAKRSTELNGFRKQFSRHRSFTYGEGKRQSLGQNLASRGAARQSIKEEEDPSSFMEESPCPGGASKLAPRLLAAEAQHGQSSVNGVTAEEATGSSAAAAAAAAAAGDTSFGSVGDSSFEDGIGDSPCAAAGSRKPVMILQPRMGSLGVARRPLLRAGTTGNILPRYMS